MNKKIETKEELAFLESLEDWDWVSLKWEELSGLKTILFSAATNTAEKRTKRKPISVRILETDISKLKAIWMKEWIPYQTLITKLVHSFTSWKIKEI